MHLPNMVGCLPNKSKKSLASQKQNHPIHSLFFEVQVTSKDILDVSGLIQSKHDQNNLSKMYGFCL